MPSIFSRFLGRKKPSEPTPLLGGEKYEAVPHTVSPSASTFPDAAHQPQSPSKKKNKSQNGPFIARRKQSTSEVKPAVEAPILSLDLPDPRLEEKKVQGLGVIFQGITDGPPLLSDEILGEKRLSPTQTLYLVQKTAEVIYDHGLEALGVMRPHWFASSRQQESQLKLISRFIQSLPSQQSDGNAGPSTATLESELRYTRDPHDVAAVLRWGLRHLRLDNDSFGSTANWYQSFVDSERSLSYPVKAFDDILLPLLPSTHSQLLRNVLDLVSSLAAHSEQNGISGNKLSKVLGWWIISSRNVQGSEWQPFYKQWEAAARQFEHLFLAYIRAQEAQSRMPKRLTQLVKGYPFVKNRREEDSIYLPRSRFSTRNASALYIRISVDKSTGAITPHPLRIVEDAFNANPESDEMDEFIILWQNIRKIANQNDSKDVHGTNDSEQTLDLSAVLADESIRLLSLVPVIEDTNGPSSSLWAPMTITRGRRSLSVGERPASTATSSAENARRSPSTTTHELEVVKDWQAFSSTGFQSPSGISLAASLFDNDMEVSQPVPPKKTAGLNRKNLSLRSTSTSPRRKSKESPLPPPQPVLEQPRRLTFSRPELVELDEAFIDFWADTLLDAIARNWPTFVVCQLKTLPLLQLNEGDKPIEWLVIERVIATPVAVEELSVPTRKIPSPPASPSQSESSKSGKRLIPTFSPTRKRWSLFFPKHDSAPLIQGGRDRSSKKAAVDAKVNEMGEILKEEDEASTKANGIKENGTHGVKENGANGVKAHDSNGVANGANGINVLEKERKRVEKKAVPLLEDATIPTTAIHPEEQTRTKESAASHEANVKDVRVSFSEEVATFAAAAAGPETLAGILMDTSKGPIPSDDEKASTEIVSSEHQHPATKLVGHTPQPVLEVVDELVTEGNTSIPAHETTKEPVISSTLEVQQLAEPIPTVEELAPVVEGTMKEPAPVMESLAIQESVPMQSHTEEVIPESEVAVVEPDVAAFKPEVARPELETAELERDIAVFEPEIVILEPEVAATEPEITGPKIVAIDQEAAPSGLEVIAQAEPEPHLADIPKEEAAAAVHEPEVTLADEPEVPAREIDVSALEPEVAAAVEEPEPEPEGVAEPELEVVVKHEPEVVGEESEVAEQEPEVVAEPEPEVVAEPEPEVVVKPEPEVVAEPEPEVVAEPEPEVVAEPQVAEPGREVVTELEVVEPETAIVVESGLEAAEPIPEVVGAEPEVILEHKPEVIGEPEPEVAVEPEPESVPEAISEPEPELIVDPALEVAKRGSEVVAEAEREPEVIAESEASATVEPEIEVIQLAPEPTPQFIPEPAPEVVPEPASEVVPEPAPEAVPEPAPEVVPEPAQEVVPEPAQEVVPEPAQEVVPEPAQEVVPEPAQEVVPEPAQEVVPEPAQEVVPEPAQEVVPEPAQEFVPKPAQEFVPEPVQEFVPEPVQEFVPEPVQEFVPEPVQEFVPEPVQEFVPEPAQESVPEPVQEFVPEPVQEFVPEPAPEVASEPASEVVPEPAPEAARENVVIQVGN